MTTRMRPGRPARMPATPLGKMLYGMRTSVHLRRNSEGADPFFRRKIAAHPHNRGLTRLEALEWLDEWRDSRGSGERIERISVEILRHWENEAKKPPGANALEDLLAVYGFSPDDYDYLRNRFIKRRFGSNPHLIDWNRRHMLVGECGANIDSAYKIGAFATTWREVEKSRTGGYRTDEVEIRVEDKEIVPPQAFVSIADRLKQANEVHAAGNERGVWEDNETLCLVALAGRFGSAREERRKIALHMRKSWYRYNVVAKSKSGSQFRFEALQNSSSPPAPVPHLASGVGISVGLICDGGSSFVVGQRSEEETFRKGEYDVAATEGMNYYKDLRGESRIDVWNFARRAITEEMGRPAADAVRRLVVFEFGCDLEYYQWNFLAFAEVDLPFEKVYESWQSAEDTSENVRVFKIPCVKNSIENFVVANPIWSTGAACALRMFDHLK